MNNKVLIFDLFADFGQVKKIYTTMSPLSFPFPSRTVLQGIIGAIVGIDKQKNPETFIDENTYIGIRLLNPVKKLVVPHNNIKVTSKSHFARYAQHKPTNIEFLKDVKYRVYFSTDNQELYNTLKHRLKTHTSFYTPTIGLSQCLANFEFVGEVEQKLVESNQDSVTLHSVFPKSEVKFINFESVECFTVTLPNRMKNDREVVEYKEFIYEAKGKELEVKIDSFVQLSNGENIVYL